MVETEKGLLDQPIGSTVRVIVGGQLAEWEKVRTRLGNARDLEAVHDFRVALRRLRSMTRAFRADLGKRITRRLRARLKALARESSESRDLQVQRAWLQDKRLHLSDGELAGADWLLARLEQRQREADAAFAKAVSRSFGPTARMLGRVVRGLEAERRLAEPELASTRVVLRRELHRHSDDLSRKLGAISGVDAVAEAHAARIAAKRLRYLVEPFRMALANAEAFVTRLKALQDALGDLHDRLAISALLGDAIREAARAEADQLCRQLLPGKPVEETPPNQGALLARPSLIALARVVREEAAALFATLESEWFGTHPTWLEERTSALLDDLLAKEGGVEIERKYLLSAVPERARLEKPLEIEQGWLPGKALLERLRHVRSDTGEQWYRTVKSGEGLKRLEIEEPTSREIFDTMWPLTEGKPISKRRYRVVDQGWTWEIDEFVDRGLVMAELEIPTETTAVDPPDWLGDYLVREVTEDPDYLNYNLAR